MVRFSRLSAGLVALLMTVPVMAQFGQGGPGGGRRGGFGGAMGGRGQGVLSLISNNAVQEDLGVTGEQKEKLRALGEEIAAKTRESFAGGGDFGGFRDLSPEEREQRAADMRKRAEENAAKIQAEFKPKLAEILDEVQMERLQQIAWQVAEGRALQDPELASQLNLTQEQKDKIAKIFAPQEGERGGFGGGGGDLQERIARMTEEREKRNNEAVAVLTAEQQSKYDELKGAAFDVAQLRQGSGGFGGRGDGQGGGRRNRQGGERRQRPDSDN